ncbi:MAG: TetR/AcrR family transcriptional regulator [Pseudomonadales bacterium]|nr:TetR/AcrR family transcriptional regulator [Pseudomonadales bacterium]MCP5184122.1 TetR/AcrR family transcriptional regulator [Pseudomonadales bacterium]
MPARLSRHDLLISLADVFRTHGYAGASLALLAERSGLSKASLYHHFPGGKLEMATSLLRTTAADAGTTTFDHLNTDQPPFTRLQAMLDGFILYTLGGRRPCLLTILGRSSTPELHQAVQDLMRTWQHQLEATFTAIKGIKPKRAARLAEEMLCGLYGASLMAELQGDPGYVERAVKRARKVIDSLN